MVASTKAELLKLGKRPATWILGLVFLAVVVFLNYLLSYTAIVGVENVGGGQLSPEARQFLPRLYPENSLGLMLGTFSGLGGAIALILGALATGNEYGWDTLKTTLTRRKSRLEFFSGKLAILGVILAAFTVIVLAIGALSSYIIATIQDAPVSWPSPLDMLGAAGAGWLMLVTFAFLGVLLGTLFRGTALAIGLGIIYIVVLEGLFLGIPAENETFQTIGKALPGKNASDLAGAFREYTVQSGAASGLEAVDPTQAALVLGVYLLVFLILAGLLFRRRDVT